MLLSGGGMEVRIHLPVPEALLSWAQVCTIFCEGTGGCVAALSPSPTCLAPSVLLHNLPSSTGLGR